ncbi:MAG: hypothetical protein E7295_16735 [Lachnospiraceae bacterium]|nr:hypothetical protein [Lachnospiraceae bacterium]
MGYETKARENHRNGNNCSASLFRTFADQLGMSEEEFEQRFLEQNGDNKCASLIMKRRLQGKNCNDLVGETASIIESLL